MMNLDLQTGVQSPRSNDASSCGPAAPATPLESGTKPSSQQLVPFVSVIVPVRNEERFIKRTLVQLIAQDYPRDRYEILVIDGRSTDATKAIAESLSRCHPHLTVFDNPRRLSSSARNIGLSQARGELIVVVDGHCELDGPGYLHRVAEAFRKSGADCLGRPQPLEVGGASTLQKAIAAARSSWLGHHPDSFIYSSTERFVPAKSVAVAYRRTVFDQVGKFDETFDACEDYELNHRIDREGLRCFFTPAVRIRYFPRSSLQGLFRQLARYGRGRVRLLRKHPETFSFGGFIPAAWLAGLIMGPVFGLLWPPTWWIYGGVMATYATIVLATSVISAFRAREPRFLVLLPLVFLTVHAGSGWGVVGEFLSIHRPSDNH